jgi:hypothetical protein
MYSSKHLSKRFRLQQDAKPVNQNMGGTGHWPVPVVNLCPQCAVLFCKRQRFSGRGNFTGFCVEPAHSHMKELLILGGNGESLFKGYNLFSLIVYVLFSS